MSLIGRPPRFGGDTPDAGMGHREGDRLLAVASNRSAVVTPEGAWCGSHVAAQRSWMRPPLRRSSMSRGSECELVVRQRGSRRRPGRGLHRRSAPLWAFPSPTQRRSPIACESPLGRLQRRTLGGRPADHSTHEAIIHPGSIAAPFLNSLAWLFVRTAPAVRVGAVKFLSKAGGQEPARLFVYK